MTSKDAILSAIRRQRPAECPVPDLNRSWITYPDPRRQFMEVLRSVGGLAIAVAGPQQLDLELRQLPAFAEAKKIVSLVPGALSAESNVDWQTIENPHALDDVDLAILPGEFAVAENGAVWVTDQNVPQRVIYFLCQHLVLVMPAAAIVNNMHEAYERLATAGDNGDSAFATARFGTFISGPSKTADIEQSLVIGAHGARSLTVLLIDV